MKCICGTEATEHCSKCKKQVYCSVKCQKADWTSHKKNCILILDWHSPPVLNFIKPKVVIDYVDLSSKLTQNAPVVSVGSGNGVLEYQISEELKRDIICVDPEPESFNTFPKDGKYIAPKYKYHTELDKSYIDECQLLLIWPTQGNEASYDLDSIKFLNPKSIIILYEKWILPKDHIFNQCADDNGAAGSYALHSWLREQKSYKLIRQHHHFLNIINGTLFQGDKNHFLELYLRSDIKADPELVKDLVVKKSKTKAYLNK